jgi:UDP-N-acetylglucosamine 2-epimerase (non-hydrolysing)
MQRIAFAVAELARRHPTVLFVLPLHRNPTVRESVIPVVSRLDNVVVGEPSDYWSFARLMQKAHVLLTDSGGVQEEGPSLGKPVLVTRDTTERPEAVEAGVARLVGTNAGEIVAAVDELLIDASAHAAMANAINPYGDGRAAERTVHSLDRILGGGAAVEEFVADAIASP